MKKPVCTIFFIRYNFVFKEVDDNIIVKENYY